MPAGNLPSRGDVIVLIDQPALFSRFVCFSRQLARDFQTSLLHWMSGHIHIRMHKQVHTRQGVQAWGGQQDKAIRHRRPVKALCAECRFGLFASCSAAIFPNSSAPKPHHLFFMRSFPELDLKLCMRCACTILTSSQGSSGGDISSLICCERYVHSRLCSLVCM